MNKANVEYICWNIIELLKTKKKMSFVTLWMNLKDLKPETNRKGQISHGFLHVSSETQTGAENRMVERWEA